MTGRCCNVRLREERSKATGCEEGVLLPANHRRISSGGELLNWSRPLTFWLREMTVGVTAHKRSLRPGLGVGGGGGDAGLESSPWEWWWGSPKGGAWEAVWSEAVTTGLSQTQQTPRLNDSSSHESHRGSPMLTTSAARHDCRVQIRPPPPWSTSSLSLTFCSLLS